MTASTISPCQIFHSLIQSLKRGTIKKLPGTFRTSVTDPVSLVFEAGTIVRSVSTLEVLDYTYVSLTCMSIEIFLYSGQQGNTFVS